MRAPWSRRQQKQEQERRQEQSAALESRFSSTFTVTSMAVTARMWNTSYVPPPFDSAQVLADLVEARVAERLKEAFPRTSKKSTLEPIHVDPPSLRPVRHFE